MVQVPAKLPSGVGGLGLEMTVDCHMNECLLVLSKVFATKRLCLCDIVKILYLVDKV